MIKSIADVGRAAFEEAKQHEALNNSPEMQKALVLDRLQAHIDEQRKAIANEDLETYRRIVAATPAQ